MKQFLALFLCLLVPSLAFADSGYKVTYDGGSVQSVKAGAKVKLYIDANQVRVVDGKTNIETIPASSITEISYGQDVHRRIGAAIGIGLFTFGVGALMALTKSKKHFVGLTWATGPQKGDLRCSVTRMNIVAYSPAWKVYQGRKQSTPKR